MVIDKLLPCTDLKGRPLQYNPGTDNTLTAKKRNTTVDDQ